MSSVKRVPDWVSVIVGVALVVCGLVIWFLPAASLVAATVVAGALLVVAGVLDFFEFARFRNTPFRSSGELMYAVLDIALGILLLLHPAVFSSFVPWIIGIGFLIFGAAEIFFAMRVRSLGIAPWGWTLFSGIVGIACGVAFLAWPPMLSLFVALFMVMRGATLVVYGATARIWR